MSFAIDLDLRMSSDMIARARAAVSNADSAPAIDMAHHLGTLQAHTGILADALERAHAALAATQLAEAA